MQSSQHDHGYHARKKQDDDQRVHDAEYKKINDNSNSMFSTSKSNTIINLSLTPCWNINVHINRWIN